MDGMDTIQDCGCCGPLLSVLLDLGIRSPDRTIIDGTDLVPFIDSHQGAWAELCRVTSPEVGRLLPRQWANRHAQWDLLCEGSPDLFGEVCRRWVIAMAFGVIQRCFNGVFTREFALEGPHSRGGEGGNRDRQGNARGKDLRVLPIWVPGCVCELRDQLQVEGLPVWCGVLVARMEDLSDVLQQWVWVWVLLGSARD